MNNKEFISELSVRLGYKSADTQKLVNSLIDSMSDAFLEGDSVVINNFGTFEVKKKLERIIVNPATGQRMLVPPKLVLGFKQSDSWKTEMRNEGGRK
jgi:DNA-binding protein HU-beta/integration host factor subunit alpha